MGREGMRGRTRVTGAWISLPVSNCVFHDAFQMRGPARAVRGRIHAHLCYSGGTLACTSGYLRSDADRWRSLRVLRPATAMTVYDDADSSMHSNGGVGGPSALPSGPDDEDSLPPLEKARRRRSMLPTR